MGGWQRLLLLPGLHVHLRRCVVAYVRLHRVDAVCGMLYLLSLHSLSVRMRVFVCYTAPNRGDARKLVGRVPVACGRRRFCRRVLLFQHELSWNLDGLRQPCSLSAPMASSGEQGASQAYGASLLL
jgi:hypothetical protein